MGLLYLYFSLFETLENTLLKEQVALLKEQYILLNDTREMACDVSFFPENTLWKVSSVVN